MAIPQSDLVALIIGSVASITSFVFVVLYSLIAIFYHKGQKRILAGTKRVKHLSITIDGKTTDVEASSKDAKKILRVLNKYKSDDILPVNRPIYW